MASLRLKSLSLLLEAVVAEVMVGEGSVPIIASAAGIIISLKAGIAEDAGRLL